MTQGDPSLHRGWSDLQDIPGDLRKVVQDLQNPKPLRGCLRACHLAFSTSVEDLRSYGQTCTIRVLIHPTSSSQSGRSLCFLFYRCSYSHVHTPFIFYTCFGFLGTKFCVCCFLFNTLRVYSQAPVFQSRASPLGAAPWRRSLRCPSSKITRPSRHWKREAGGRRMERRGGYLSMSLVLVCFCGFLWCFLFFWLDGPFFSFEIYIIYMLWISVDCFHLYSYYVKPPPKSQENLGTRSTSPSCWEVFSFLANIQLKSGS